MVLSEYNNLKFERGSSGLKEVLWLLVRGFFFQTIWPWPSALRASLLRLFGAKVGEGVVIRDNVNISFPWRFTIGNHVWIGEDVGILSLAPVTIESDVCISQRAYLCTGSHDFRSRTFDLVTKPITIRAGSWIAASVIVLPGVTIGPNSLVSAGSVVDRDVPANCIVRGNPAEVVRTTETQTPEPA